MARTKPAPATTSFTDPGPDLAIADVPGMPPAAAVMFAHQGVRTLGDLRPFVEAEALGDPQCEPVFVLTAKWQLPLIVRYKAGDRLIALLGGRAHMLEVMTGWPKPVPAPHPDDFDEQTPPPRTRPKGVPLRNEERLPPGEDLVGIFRQWDRDGRVSSGSLLCELIGMRPFGSGTDSGYRLLVATTDARIGSEAGEEVSAAELIRFRVSTVIRRQRTANWFAIFAPRIAR